MNIHIFRFSTFGLCHTYLSTANLINFTFDKFKIKHSETPLTEFNPVQQPLLNEKVLRDKRKKLRETFERIVRLYERENPDTYKELRKIELDYETKRGQLALYFDSVKVCVCVSVWLEGHDQSYTCFH